MILHVLSFVDTYNPVTDCIYSVLRHKERILWPPSRAPHRVVTHILLSSGVKPHHLDLQFVSNLPPSTSDWYRVLAIVLHFIHLYSRCFDDLVFFFYLFILSNFSQKHVGVWNDAIVLTYVLRRYNRMSLRKLIQTYTSLYVRDDCLKFEFML